MCRLTAVLSLTLTAAGCGLNSRAPASDLQVTDSMREACPMLSDELLEAWILAVDGLREDLPDAEHAIAEWVAGCENVPPDGNFQGDQEACAACLTVIVEELYEVET
ncbi:MAG: hypothetical protein JSU63_10575 [Phycisphaerales bacterium]|nr:MAG: hypothetical protein JSU63_10575 [Phycisphaerales bacterium]